MLEPPMYITAQQFESAMIELSARPELFDILFDENVTFQLTTGYLAFDCSNIRLSSISDDICKIHLCYLLSNQKLRNEFTAILFKNGSPKRSTFETVAELMVQVAYQRFLMRQPRSQGTPVAKTAL